MKLFITGTFRAGTTLAAQVLNQHPDLGVTYDSVHFMRFAYRRYGDEPLAPEAALRLGSAVDGRLESRFGRGFDMAGYRSQVDALDRITYADVYDIIMRLYVGKRHWGEKTVLQWRNAGDILGLFDDIVIIHCLRDPRDVLSSWRRETIAPGVDYLDAIANCFDSMTFAVENRRQFGKRYLVLRYEDLVQSPVATIQSLCNDLGIAYHDGMLDTGRFRNKVTEQPWQPNTAFDGDIAGISASPIGRWHEHLEKEDLILCEVVNRARMADFGYRLSGETDHLSIEVASRVLEKLKKSPLAFEGIMNILSRGRGVQRYPLDESDPATWERNVAKL